MPDETNTPPNETTTSSFGGGRRRASFRPPDAKASSKADEKSDEQKAEEGHPDALAQIKLAKHAGPSTLRAALDSLPAIPALDGIKANFEHYSSDELIEALKGLPLPEDNEGAIETRDEIVRRLEAGDFRR